MKGHSTGNLPADTVYHVCFVLLNRYSPIVTLFCTLSSVKLILYAEKPEVNSLTFVTADSSRAQLERLTLLLVSAFPGSTIYQHPDPFRVPHDVLNNKVDAVFLEAEAEETHALNLINLLHRQKPDLPVFMISKTNQLGTQAVEKGAVGYFVLPGGEEQLLNAIRLVKAGKPHQADV